MKIIIIMLLYYYFRYIFVEKYIVYQKMFFLNSYNNNCMQSVWHNHPKHMLFQNSICTSIFLIYNFLFNPLLHIQCFLCTKWYSYGLKWCFKNNYYMYITLNPNAASSYGPLVERTHRSHHRNHLWDSPE